MSVAEGNVSLATDLPKCQLLFTIKGNGAVASDLYPPSLPSLRDKTMSAHSAWFPA